MIRGDDVDPENTAMGCMTHWYVMLDKVMRFLFHFIYIYIYAYTHTYIYIYIFIDLIAMLDYQRVQSSNIQ